MLSGVGKKAKLIGIIVKELKLLNKKITDTGNMRYVTLERLCTTRLLS